MHGKCPVFSNQSLWTLFIWKPADILFLVSNRMLMCAQFSSAVTLVLWDRLTIITHLFTIWFPDSLPDLTINTVVHVIAWNPTFIHVPLCDYRGQGSNLPKIHLHNKQNCLVSKPPVVCLPVCLSVNPSVCLPSLCLSVLICLAICLSVSFCLCLCPITSVRLSVCLSVYPSAIRCIRLPILSDLVIMPIKYLLVSSPVFSSLSVCLCPFVCFW